MSTKIASKNTIIFQSLLDAFPKEFIHIPPLQQKISITLYRLLAEGYAVTLQQLAKKSDTTELAVDEMLNSCGGSYFNDDKDIIGFWGLTIEPTGKKFIVDDKVLYAWCAWDTLFLPGILGKTAEVYSTCPISNDTIHLTVSPSGIQNMTPTDTCMSFVGPDENGIREDVVSNFCHAVLFFNSSQSGQQWVNDHPGTFVMGLQDGFTLAQMKNQQKYSNSL